MQTLVRVVQLFQSTGIDADESKFPYYDSFFKIIEAFIGSKFNNTDKIKCINFCNENSIDQEEAILIFEALKDKIKLTPGIKSKTSYIISALNNHKSEFYYYTEVDIPNNEECRDDSSDNSAWDDDGWG